MPTCVTYSRFSQNEVRQSRGQIQFDEVGAKWLVTAYAKLKARSLPYPNPLPVGGGKYSDLSILFSHERCGNYSLLLIAMCKLIMHPVYDKNVYTIMILKLSCACLVK